MEPLPEVRTAESLHEHPPDTRALTVSGAEGSDRINEAAHVSLFTQGKIPVAEMMLGFNSALPHSLSETMGRRQMLKIRIFQILSVEIQ